jgi:ABC-type transport system involved in multi-copper enzyme maturation permease subunit
VALAVVLSAYAIWYWDYSEVSRIVADFLRVLVITAAILLSISLGLRLAGSVSGEREQGTLESLIAMPEYRRDILTAKWVGAWFRVRIYAICFALALLLFAFMGAARPAPCLFMVFVVFVHTLFVGNLGLYLSLACRTTARASTFFLLILLLIVASTWGAKELLPIQEPAATEISSMRADFDDDHQLTAGLRALNPLLAWWHLLERAPSNFSREPENPFVNVPNNRPANSAENSRRQIQDGAALFWGTMLYLAAAGILWLIADRRIRKNPMNA